MSKMVSERWKTIPDYPLYMVSNTGRLKHYWKRAGWKFLCEHKKPNSCGYKIVKLIRWVAGIRQHATFQLHRLVGKAFVKNPDKLRCIDHINGNKLDNRASNLRWATYSQNNVNSELRQDNMSGVRGVHWHKQAQKWCARISHKGEDIYIGVFDSRDDAEFMRLSWEDELFDTFMHPTRRVRFEKLLKVRC